MKINRLLALAVMPLIGVIAMAQTDNTPKKGDFVMAATMGYNSYTTISALDGSKTFYEGGAISTNWAEKKIGIGMELGIFSGDTWKWTLGGGFNATNNPGYPGVDGTFDQAMDEIGDGSIPTYRAIADAKSVNYNVFVGIDKYYKVAKVTNLMWYTGLRAGIAYGMNQQRYDEVESMGKSTAETVNLRGAIAIGADYFLAKGIYVGVQVEPFAYTYNMTVYKPQEGLSALDADSHNFSVLSAPTLKLGFKF